MRHMFTDLCLFANFCRTSTKQTEQAYFCFFTPTTATKAKQEDSKVTSDAGGWTEQASKITTFAGASEEESSKLNSFARSWKQQSAKVTAFGGPTEGSFKQPSVVERCMPQRCICNGGEKEVTLIKNW